MNKITMTSNGNILPCDVNNLWEGFGGNGGSYYSTYQGNGIYLSQNTSSPLVQIGSRVAIKDSETGIVLFRVVAITVHLYIPSVSEEPALPTPPCLLCVDGLVTLIIENGESETSYQGIGIQINYPRDTTSPVSQNEGVGFFGYGPYDYFIFEGNIIIDERTFEKTQLLYVEYVYPETKSTTNIEALTADSTGEDNDDEILDGDNGGVGEPAPLKATPRGTVGMVAT